MSEISDELGKFMQEVKSLEYTDKPDYAKLQSILQQGLKSMGASDDKKLDFTVLANVKSLPSVKVRVFFIKTLESQSLDELYSLSAIENDTFKVNPLTPGIYNKLISTSCNLFTCWKQLRMLKCPHTIQA